MAGRREKLDRPKRLTSKLPSSLMNAFENSLVDHSTGNIPVGARQGVLIRLIRAYLRGQDALEYFRLVRNLRQAIGAGREYTEELKALLTHHAKVEKTTEDFENAGVRSVDLSDMMG